MRREVLLTVAVLGIAACGSPASQKTKDPNAPALEPAVVAAPLDVPKPPTPPPTPKSTIIPADDQQRTSIVLQGYGLVAATMVNHDARMLSQLYEQNAVFHGPDSTLTGRQAVVAYLINLARAKSLADFQRISRGQRVVDDSTLVDSGLYRMVLKRFAKDSTIESGRFKATWRARKDIGQWVMLEDALTPDTHTKKKGAR